eukprot:g26668.t1
MTIGTASCSHKELEQFISFPSTFHPNFKFTWTISNTSLSFLDLSVSMSGDRLKTDIYFKPTDSHSYLDYTSSHPPSCKNAIPYSQFLHFHCIRSQDRVFHSRQAFTCTSVNLVYCIRCSRCGLLYVSETKRRLRDRFVEQLRSVCDKRQHLLVANHFNSPSHSLCDMSILGRLQYHNDTTCKLEEQHLIFRLGTLQPNGLNMDFT